MRDLKADLKGLQANPSDWTELPRGLVVEYLERAIAAGKKNTESYDLLYGVFDKVKEEAELLKIDKAALTEENDLQRASIQQLSAQVVRMQETLNAVHGFFEEMDKHTHVHSLDMGGLHGVSMQIRPGEKGREYHEASWKMRKALAELSEDSL